jgi:ribosomal protein S18 acetylase RimI-like enzyme
MGDELVSPWGLRQVELADRPVFEPYFASLTRPLSDYSFSQLYTWRNSLKIYWKVVRNHLCVFANGTGDLTLLLPPIGDTGSDAAMADCFELMDEYNARHGVPERSRVEYVSDELAGRFGRAGYDMPSMGADYIYDVTRMIDLAGGDLASKRQAKNRFMRNYAWRVEPYCAARHLEPCRALLAGWKAHQDAQHAGGQTSGTDALKRSKESMATDLTLEAAETLGMKGMVVWVRGGGEGSGFRVQGSEQQGASPSRQTEPSDSVAGSADGDWSIRAFTFGEYLGRDQSNITVEKTDLDVKGLAQFIFSEFCRTGWADRPLVNVGDDWGLESLAWTKTSYRPVARLQKYVLRRPAAVQIAVPAPVELKPAVVAEPVPACPQTEPVACEIRRARRTDLAAAASLEQSCFNDHQITARQLQYLQSRPSAVFLVAEADGQVVGDGIALVRQHKRGLTGRIYSLAVRDDWRGRRLGRRLLGALIDELAARGVRRTYLEVSRENEAAIALYEKLGFRTTGTLADYYGPGRAALHMVYEATTEAQMAQAPMPLAATA